MNITGLKQQQLTSQVTPAHPLTLHKPLLTRLLWLLLIAAAVLPGMGNAHRSSDDKNDPCRVQIGSETIHFTAYTPTFTGQKNYCKVIPNVGVTNLVFDYEGKKLRQYTIEFEITKEPEGNRVYYRAPDTSKTGTVDGTIDFSKFGEGNYKAHVTLIEKDEKLDTHIPFSVGLEEEDNFIGVKKFLFTVFVCGVIIYLSIRFSRGKADTA